MAITSQQARAELARRELARRELSRRETVTQKQGEIRSNPDFQGGPNAPAVLQANKELKQLQDRELNVIDPAVGLGRAAYNATWPISMLAKNAMGQELKPIAEPTTGGGKLLADMGILANPATGKAIELGVKGFGTVAKGLGNFGKTLSNINKFSKPENQVKLAEEFQDTLASQRRSVIDNYGKEYEDIVGKSQAKVNLNNSFKNFMDESQSLMQNPEFSQQIAAKNPQAMKIFDLADKITKAGDIESISSKEADNLVKYIRNLPSIKTKLNQAGKFGKHTVQWTNEDRMLLNLADDIKGGVIEAHPELQALNKDYGRFMNAYKRVAPDFKVGTTISKLKSYSQYDPQKAQLLEGIVPKQTMDKVRQFEGADKTYQMLRNIGLIAGGGAITGMGIKGGSSVLEKAVP
jgi:hypothetical protein